MSNKDWPVTDPVADKPFFVFDPDGDTEFFATRAERDAAAEKVVDSCLDEFWDEQVTNVFVGFVTGVSREANRKDRPDDLDEDGIDSDGEQWHPDWDFKCDYKVQPLVGDKPPSPCQLLAQAAELVMLAGQAMEGGEYSESELNSEQFLVLRHGIAKAARDLNQLHSSADLVEFGGK
ncbi:MAG: hypothetical protein CMH98_19005 [Oceanospirillaceae bacterium]|nr:hypothetical protein [Oceanospirillaceae bacterium]